MNKILDFWAQNSAVITQFVVAFIGVLATYLFNKFLNRTGNKVLNYSTQVVSKMFGGDVSLNDVDKNISKLGFVEDFYEFAKTTKESRELRLIDVKRKIKSPNLSKVERLVFENEYKVLSKMLAENISEETKEILRKIDEYTVNG